VFLGHSVTQHKQISDETAHVIDEEIRHVIDMAYAHARKILVENRDKLDIMAAALIKYETIGEDQIKDIIAGREPRPPQDWEDTAAPSGGGIAGQPEPVIGPPASQT
jgi:cell division protease FtsH